MPCSRWFLCLLLPLGVFLGACTTNHTVAAESPQSNPPHGSLADDTARFLAGMPGSPGRPFAALEETDAWKEQDRKSVV